MPVIGAPARRLRRAVSSRSFYGSVRYWEDRYRRGGKSGDGSYGRLALFKAEVVNDFVSAHGVTSVLELGCGDGAQLQLAVYPSYTGVDVSCTSIDHCRRLFGSDPSKIFVHSSNLDRVHRHDLGLSLDVVYHLVEDSVFERYMSDLFRLSNRFVIVYSSNTERSHDRPHIRHREFTNWVERNASTWILLNSIQNRYAAQIGEEDEEHSFASFFVFERVG